MEKTDKKRPIEETHMDSAESSDSEMESDNGGGSDDEPGQEQHINIEFEAQTPTENDFHGIKQLLIRLFCHRHCINPDGYGDQVEIQYFKKKYNHYILNPLDYDPRIFKELMKVHLIKSFLLQHVDLSEMTDLLIKQDNVGSTIKVVDDEEDEVYGITSVLSLKKHKEKACIKELKKGILNKCKTAAPDKSQQLETIFEKNNVGFLINERFINVPPQIAGPFHNSLLTEVNDALSEDSTFDFDYLLLMSKTLRPTKLPDNAEGSGGTSKSKKKKKKMQPMEPDEIEYTNFEDEVFQKVSEMSFSYSVTESTGFAIGGNWDFGDQIMNTYRTVMLIPKNKWRQAVSNVEELLEG